MLRTISLTAGVLLMASAAHAQQAITVNIGSSHPVANIWAYAMKNAFQPEVDRILAEKGEYRINWSEAYAGTLYKFTDTRAAVRDGVVDVGMVGTVWEGSTMPLQNVTYFTPFATDDHQLLIEIFDKLTAEMPELRDSWDEQNMVYLSSLVTDNYNIYADFPVGSMADLQNQRINAPGTAANWLTGTGATPVDGAATTYYTNIQTGVTKGALSFATAIYPARIHEVAPHLTRVGIGAMYFGGIAANKDFWNTLPAPVQEAFVAAGKTTSGAHGEYVTELFDIAIAEMEKTGLQTTDLPDAEKAAWVETLPNIIEPWLAQTGEAGRAVLDAYFAELRSRGVVPLRDWDAQQ